jgi:hypothetical protein
MSDPIIPGSLPPWLLHPGDYGANDPLPPERERERLARRLDDLDRPYLTPRRPGTDHDEVEAVARAIWDVAMDPHPWPTADGTWSQHERDHYRAMARAALAARRPATEAEQAVDEGVPHG